MPRESQAAFAVPWAAARVSPSQCIKLPLSTLNPFPAPGM